MTRQPLLLERRGAKPSSFFTGFDGSAKYANSRATAAQGCSKTPAPIWPYKSQFKTSCPGNASLNPSMVHEKFRRGGGCWVIFRNAGASSVSSVLGKLRSEAR